MGIETEYGITVPGYPTMNAMVTSTHVVNAYAMSVARHARRTARWDYDEESPLRDARGFDMTRAEADPSQLTDEDLGLANVILTNGARLYVDHAHPEYSAPEVMSPRDAVLWDRAGMLVMAQAAALATESTGLPIHLYKNNTDNKGASYGTHENYLMRRTTPFADIVRHLTPFFVSRQIFTGSGRLGVGQDGRNLAFQLSQRADFFEVEVGLETTLKRPIINTRDEPHADPERYRRLHVIVGDANLSDTATLLKTGTTSLILAMIEDGFLNGHDMALRDPVKAMHQVSHDVSLREPMEMRDGRTATAVDLQSEYLRIARKFVEERGGGDSDTSEVLLLWEHVLEDLARDPARCADRLDWVAKQQLMEGSMARHGIGWANPRLQAIDLQYSDVRPERGLAQRLESMGSLRRLFDDAEVSAAVTDPPTTTRAYFRGECMRRYPNEVAAASWDSVVFDLPGQDSLLRVPTMEPTRGTAEHVSSIFESSPTAADLVRALSGT